MNLTVIEKDIIKTLPVSFQEFVTAKFKKQIHAYTDRELVEQIKNLVIKTLFESGVKDSGDSMVVTFLRETLMQDLRHPKFARLTFEEIALAFNKGVRQEYGPYMGVNIQTMHGWIKSYLASTERGLAVKEFFLKVGNQEEGIQDRAAKPNPEGQKKVVEMIKGILKDIPEEEPQRPKRTTQIEKSEYDKKVQELFMEFTKLSGEEIQGKKYVKIEGVDRPLDEVEYVEYKLNQDGKQK